MQDKKLMETKIYYVSNLTWIPVTVMSFLVVSVIGLFILLIPQVLTIENLLFMTFVIFCLIFLMVFMVYAGLQVLDILTTRLELSENGVVFYSTGYRIYTPWENISGISWTRFSRSFPGFIQLKEPALVGKISFEEGKKSRQAVTEKRRWWMTVWQLKREKMYTHFIRLPVILFRRRDKKAGSIQYFRFYVPYLFVKEMEKADRANN